ncbi:protein argonaute 2-like [Bidens hawaiensis]|uniref:protein argonaute 2-like n=1 Tax=Bidens hawaiensis TaxID=980011 RepID=UPI00404B81F6
MDRSNYNNRGGYDNRGGGRNTGGGRGDYGRGGRGGRGNWNQQQPQQQYSNQYGRGRGGGGGRGRESGGQRGQHTYQAPAANPNAWNRVNSGQPVGSQAPLANPSAWNRVASGRPVGSQASSGHSQTLTPNRHDLQVQEISNRMPSLSVTDHSKGGLVPIKRPDRGTLAMSPVKLLVNHFPVKFNPSSSILRYDVDVKQESEEEASSSTRQLKKAIPKSSLRQIQEKLSLDYPDKFPLQQLGYDGEKNIFSAIVLQAGTYKVDFFGRSYLFTIKFGNELNLSKLDDFVRGNASQVPRDVLQALEVATKANLFREKVSVGRGMYPREHRKEDDLHCGVAAYRGFQQSFKLTSNGLIMCTDYSVMPFRKRIDVLDFLREHIREVQSVDDINRFRNKVMAALKGLKVSVTHRRTKQKYTVIGLTDKPTKDISFEMEDIEGEKKPHMVMLTDYFKEKWGKEIVHKHIPCLKVGNEKKPNFVPMEFCFLAEDRRFPKENLGKEAARKLKEQSLLAPENRRRQILNMVHDEYAPGKHGAEVIENFGISVSMEMTRVDGRVLEPPKLKLGSSNGKTNFVTLDKQKCQYNLLRGKFVTAKPLQRWGLIDFTRGHRDWIDLDDFIPKLKNRCTNLGVIMEEPLYVHRTNMRDLSNVNAVSRLLNWFVEECRKVDKGRLQMIICVMPERHDGYKIIKHVSELDIGVMTQCCLSQNANKSNNDQFLANLGLKINAKLDGSNVELVERFPHFNANDHFMFIGADVNHPAAMNKSSPSIAAVVGSVNWPAATQYAARVTKQAHRKEEIVNFGSLCLDLIKKYVEVNKVKPNNIIVFRDGVSDDQFEMVLNKEMVDMKQAIYTEQYRPFVTFVVAQKRHTTRLFLDNKNEVGNVPPGTVVDTNIVHPTNFDFYLCSHFGGMGTSKPTHYSVIWDENKFSSDEMQKMIYDLCYTFARCTKPVSLVPPVYYADLVAYRGRMFQEVEMMEANGSGSSSSGSVSGSGSFGQYIYNLDQNLKDSMFFI